MMWMRESSDGGGNKTKPVTVLVLLFWFFVVINVAAAKLDPESAEWETEGAPSVNTTSVFATRRSDFIERVDSWKRENPHLAPNLSQDAVDELWIRFRTDRVASNDDRGPARQNARIPRKRVTASADDIAAARKIVDKAIEQASRRNTYLSRNPRRNKYILKQSTNPAKPRAANIDQVAWAPTEEIREAAALLAEIEAEELYINGSLYDKYNLPYKDTPDGHVKYKIQQHGQVHALSGNYWLADLGKQYPGNNPFGKDSSYKVFRNVKDYGAVGDGKKDDTKAINQAISDGNRCGKDCGSSTVKGAVVYFPPGTYLVSSSIIAMYYTQLVSDPNNRAVLLASSAFMDLGVISSNVYTGQWNSRWNADDEWYLNTGNFFRQVRNFVIDLTKVRTKEVKGIHWQVAQASSLQNIHFKMTPRSTQIGLYIENGSGGFMSDLSFEGGQSGMLCGNQQFTSRDLIFRDCTNAITMLWDWGWVWKGLDISGGEVGINFTTSEFPGGSITVLDSLFSNVKTGVLVNMAPKKSDKQANINLLNVRYKDVGTMVTSGVSSASLKGGSGVVDTWFIGRTYRDNGNGIWSNGAEGKDAKVPEALLYRGPTGGYFARSKPQYSDRTDWVVPPAKGDGVSDDTVILQATIDLAALAKRPVFLPTGSYIITDTLLIPPGTILVGACWSQFVASGKKFQDSTNPHVMVKIGKPGDVGSVELSDLLFTATGPTAGLVAVEWNIDGTPDMKGAAAMWDCHIRIGGAMGTNLQLSNCPKLSGVKSDCVAGSLLLHLTPSSGAYLENVWVWTADHDMDDAPSKGEAQIDIYVARGILIESASPTWLWATASEHNVLYQYALSGARTVFMGLIQTESPYYLPTPSAPAPFQSAVGRFNADPRFSNCQNDKTCLVSWALIVERSHQVYIVGAGLYSWFYDNYDQSCIERMACQRRLVSIDEPSTLSIYNLFTVGTTEMLTHRASGSILAKDNQMLIERSPWTSVIASWVKEAELQSLLQRSEVSESFWADVPEKCKGIDKCPSLDLNKTPSQLAREATEGKGYLCVLDHLYHTCANLNSGVFTTGDGFDKCIYGKMGFPQYSCQGIDSLSSCPLPDGQCEEWDEHEVFWLMIVLHNFALRHQALRQMLFFNSFMSTLTDVWTITDQITKAKEKQNATTKDILRIISTVLGFVGAAIPHIPKLSEKGKARAEATAEVVDIVGMIFNTAQDNIEPEDENEMRYELHERMETGLGLFLTNATKILRRNLIDYFQFANLSTWPISVFPPEDSWNFGSHGGKLDSSLSRYLSDQRFLTTPTGTEDEALSDAMSILIKTALIMLALSEEWNYYVLQNPIWAADCNNREKFPSARMIDDNCFVLHSHGGGWDKYLDTVQDSKVYSVEMDKDIAKLFDDDTLDALYRGSVRCQAVLNAYSSDLSDDDGDTKVPPAIEIKGNDYNPFDSCIFNLPVLQVEPAEWGKPHKSTPCLVLDRQREREKKGGSVAPKVGWDYLPEYLAMVFTDEFCRIECQGRACTNTGCPGRICNGTAFGG